MTIIDGSKYFNIINQQYVHCGETQFIYQCKTCGYEPLCYYCGFDYNQPCEECSD